MDILRIVLIVSLTSCANQEWRHGNYLQDPKVNDKREDQRDKYMERAENFREQTTKHYIKSYKKRF